MKNKIIIFVILSALFVSCGEDRRKEYAEQTALDRWIESVMRENYYWYEDMPTSKKLNYFTEPIKFFSTLLSAKDKKYSYIEDPADIDGLKKYGIEFDASLRYNDTAYAVRVLYVESDSPAKEAMLERGDWIIKRNDKHILKSRIDSLYTGDAISLTRGEYKIILDENENEAIDFDDKDVVELPAARITKDNPIASSLSYRTPSGKRAGYLVYNHFTPGTSDGDFTYDNLLRNISNDFKSANLTDFILDLRYNTGGDLQSAQLLGSILAPQEALGQTMCKLRYNDKQSDKDESINFSQEILDGGSNLNLSSIYILTGPTTGSAAEVLINSLSAYMDITRIGRTTQGNHAGTHVYTDDVYPYILHPVDCMIYNAKDELPQSGFAPKYVINELNDFTYPFGSTEDPLLNAALYLIENGSLPEESAKASLIHIKTPGFNTLSKSTIHGVSIR